MENKREQQRKKIYEYAARLNVTLGSITDVGDSLMRDCIPVFKRKGVFKRELKYHANLALKESVRVQNCYRQKTDATDKIYLDFLDIIQDELKTDVDRLYIAVKLVLDRRRETDTDMKTKVLLAYILTEMNSKGYYRFKDLIERTTKKNVGGILYPMNPDGVMFQWQKVVFIVFGRMPDEIATDPSVTAGVEIICRKLFDLDWLEDKAEKSLQMK